MPGKAVAKQLPDDLADWKQDLKALWLRVWIAANKGLALLCAVAIHKSLDLAGEWLIPVGWEKVSNLFRGTFFTVFMVIYLHFLWEMVSVFVPWLNKKASVKKTEVHT